MSKEKCCSNSGCRKYGIWKCIGWGIVGVIGFAAIAALIAYSIVYLWNNLMPEIFGVAPIGIWQAIGLALLARLIFGGCGGGKSWGKHAHKHFKHDRCQCGCGCGCKCGSKCECNTEKCECHSDSESVQQ